MSGQRQERWIQGLPVIHGSICAVREPTPTDARPLFRHLESLKTWPYIVPPPATETDFGKFISASLEKRLGGSSFCFAAVATIIGEAVGLFRFDKQPDPIIDRWLFGFVIGEAFCGTGVLAEAGRLSLGFAFDVAGIETVECWCHAANKRGQAALGKLGAIFEDIVTASSDPSGLTGDFTRWTIRRTPL